MSNAAVVNRWRTARITYGTQTAAPAAPTSSNVGANGLRLTWTGVTGATSYKLQRAPHLSTAFVDVFNGLALSYDVTGLTAATQYDFRLAALNQTAQSEWSPTMSVTTAASATPPATPAAPTASNVTASTATLTATAVATATSYAWERSPNGTTGWTAVTASTGTVLNDSGLTASTSYWYRVSAVNADGSSSPSTATQITTQAAALVVPAQPARPFTLTTTSTSLQIGWTAVPTATSYQLQRSLTGAVPWANVYIGPNTDATDTGRAAGTSYFYRVSASNAAGESPQSPTLQATTPTTGPNVQPVAALDIVKKAGVCAHPNFNTPDKVWKQENAEAFISRVASSGLSFIRGALPANAVSDVWADALRAHNMKWLMTVIPEGKPSGVTNQTLAETRAEVRRISDRYADICAGIEGSNEPNQNRNGDPLQADWQQVAYDHQEAIWTTAKEVGSAIANVPIVGPSLHDVAADNSYTQANPSGGKFHFEQLRDLGILAVQDMAGLHTYSGGAFPIRKLDERLVHIYGAYGANYPVWCTETGWHNALATTLGHKPISEAGAGTYGPRAILQFVTTVKPNGIARDLRYTVFEGIDDWDGPPPFTNVELHFGMIAVSEATAALAVNPSSWRKKPILLKDGAMLNAMADPLGQAPYTPPLVVCDVSSPSAGANLQWQVVATKAQADAGQATCWIWRDMEVWDRNTRTPINVPPVAVDIRDRVGVRRFNIDAEVTPVDLR